MAARLNVTPGTRFAYLTIVEEVEPHRSPRGQAFRKFRVRCDCGNVKDVQLSSLRTGNTLSCGCMFVELHASNARHGEANTSLYGRWKSIKSRCRPTPPKIGTQAHRTWLNYGGRGIRLHREWFDYMAFAAWVRDNLGEPQPGDELDRINNDGNYEPGNLRWANHKSQNRNKRTNAMVTHPVTGEVKCLAAWAEQEGVPESRLRGYIGRGYPLDAALRLSRFKRWKGAPTHG